jgi:hypothetical protein
LEEEGIIKSINEPSNVNDHVLSAKAKKWNRFPQHKGKGKGKGKKPQGKHSHPHSHFSKVRFFNCNKLGHYARDCKNPPSKKKQNGMIHASIVAEEEEPQRKRARDAYKEQEQCEEIYLVSALSGALTKLEEIWLVDSEASKHVTVFKHNLVN